MFGLYSLQLPSSLQTKLTPVKSKTKERRIWWRFCDGRYRGFGRLTLYISTIIRGIIICCTNRRFVSFWGGNYIIFISIRNGTPFNFDHSFLVTVFLPKSEFGLIKSQNEFWFCNAYVTYFYFLVYCPKFGKILLWATLGASFFRG